MDDRRSSTLISMGSILGYTPGRGIRKLNDLELKQLEHIKNRITEVENSQCLVSIADTIQALESYKLILMTMPLSIEVVPVLRQLNSLMRKIKTFLSEISPDAIEYLNLSEKKLSENKSPFDSKPVIKESHPFDEALQPGSQDWGPPVDENENEFVEDQPGLRKVP